MSLWMRLRSGWTRYFIQESNSKSDVGGESSGRGLGKWGTKRLARGRAEWIGLIICDTRPPGGQAALGWRIVSLSVSVLLVWTGSI